MFDENTVNVMNNVAFTVPSVAGALNVIPMVVEPPAATDEAAAVVI